MIPFGDDSSAPMPLLLPAGRFESDFGLQINLKIPVFNGVLKSAFNSCSIFRVRIRLSS